MKRRGKPVAYYKERQGWTNSVGKNGSGNYVPRYCVLGVKGQVLTNPGVAATRLGVDIETLERFDAGRVTFDIAVEFGHAHGVLVWRPRER